MDKWSYGKLSSLPGLLACDTAVCITLIAVGSTLLWFTANTNLGTALVVIGAIGMAPVPISKRRKR